MPTEPPDSWHDYVQGADEHYHDPDAHGGLVEVTFKATDAGEGYHDWGAEFVYADGTIESEFFGTWLYDPDEWMWAIYEWYEFETGADVDLEYEE